MSLRTAARPFAEAAFMVAQKQQQLELWGLGLQALAVASQEEAMRQLLNNPASLRSEQIAALEELVVAALASMGQQQSVIADFSPIFANFIRQIAEDRSFKLLPDVSELFEEQACAASAVEVCKIKSATELNQDQQKRMQQVLTKHFGREVQCEFSVSPELKAGLIVRVGDWVMDGSMLGRVQRLAAVLLA